MFSAFSEAVVSAVPLRRPGLQLDGRVVAQRLDLGLQSGRAVHEPGVDLRGARQLLPGEVLAAVDERAGDGQHPLALVLAVGAPASGRRGRPRLAHHADAPLAGCG